MSEWILVHALICTASWHCPLTKRAMHQTLKSNLPQISYPFFLQNYISLNRNLIKYTLSSWGHLIFNKDLARIQARGLNPVTSLIRLQNPSTIKVVASADFFLFIGIFSGTIFFVPPFLFRTYSYYSCFASYLLPFIFFF